MSVLDRLFRRSGGTLPPARPANDSIPLFLSPGSLITDPDEAEALGMTSTARRLRERPLIKEKVCLVKGCDGPTEEPRSWVGYLLARYHWH
ncbi:hypothetical protein [Streptomyces sp. NPDC001194]|uniref:hypothetical protein n=1 Tax=Streptomyces sp. NPDC001194 TaxID=3364547 RepID=UPI0036CA0708